MSAPATTTPALEPELEAVTDAAAGYRRAAADAEEARRWLREAMQEARAAGAPVHAIARAAGVSRQRAYQTLTDRGAPRPLPGQLTVDTIGGSQ